MRRVYYTCQDVRVPNQPKTPVRSVRIDDETWEAIQAEARDRGLYVADVVREALLEHLGRDE